MTQTLKPCPFCGSDARMWPSHTKADKNGSYEIVGCSNVDCFIEPTTDEYLPYEEAVQRWNTRPAPAATDTVSKDDYKSDGLETVLIQKRVISEYDRPWLNAYLPPNKPFPPVWKDEEAGEPHELRALVTRSQAEKLLAAKDAENAYLKELVAARGETIKRGDDSIRKLEAKLAAAEKERDHLIELGLSCGYGKPNPDLPRFELACSFIKGTDEARKAADIVWQDYKKQNEALKDKLRMTPQSNMWLQEDSIDKFSKFVMEKGILESLWEISNMLGSYVDDGTPKPEADYMIKTQLFVDVLTKFYEVEANNAELHREAREAIRNRPKRFNR